ncbi:MAG TPA: hypothetical protein VFU10_06335 [Gaiellaceae bacterium]|nr:hypothetical protein [Gaiellaceae bacterium]
MPPDDEFTEPRWQLALVLAAFIVVTTVLRSTVKHHERLGPGWLVPGLEIALLVLLIAADPARIDAGRHRWLRTASIVLVSLLAVVVLTATGKLIVELIQGGAVTNEASSLLASGAAVYLGNILIFSLLYWLLDSGGPLARYRHDHEYPDFAFTQQQSPELAPPNWRPQYVDYLILGLTTSTAFSPTDVMPMARWAKMMMSAQSLIALTLVGLVIARAVNVFA